MGLLELDDITQSKMMSSKECIMSHHIPSDILSYIVSVFIYLFICYLGIFGGIHYIK